MNCSVVFLQLFVCCVVVCSCARRTPANKALVYPFSEFYDVKLYRYAKDGNVDVIVRGKGLLVFQQSEQLLVQDIAVLYIGEDEGREVLVELVGNYGLVNYNTFHCEVWGNAVLIKERHMRVETERIYWNPQGQFFSTPVDIPVLLFESVDKGQEKVIVRTVGDSLWASRLLKIVKLQNSLNVEPS